MEARALEGGFADPAIGAAHAFRAVLEAMSRPGTVQEVAGARPPAPLGAAAGAVALTLCDHDTPVWLAPSVDGQEVRDWFAFHTGAPLAGRGEAMFAFGTWAEMAPVTDFAIGTPEYPDRSATLVVEVPELGTAHRLTGPGIKGQARLTVPDLAAFEMNRALFPLGWDCVLTCGSRIAGLPRTTIVEG